MIREKFTIISKNVMKEDIIKLKEKIFELEKRIEILESKEKKRKNDYEINPIILLAHTWL